MLRLLTLASVGILGMVCSTRAQLVPLGGELQVNSYTTGSQFASGIGADPLGNFVVVWGGGGSAGSDISGKSVHAQRYDAAGAPAGPELQVNTYTTGDQQVPRVAVGVFGQFVVVWKSYYSDSADVGSYSVQAQRYDAAGAPLGGQFQVNSYSTGDQIYADVALDGGGNFVVVWHSDGSAGSDSSGYSVQVRRFDSVGAPLGGDFQVNTHTTADQSYPRVAADTGGNFVVVWHSFGSAGSDSSSTSVHGRRFDAGGAPLGGEFQVNTYTTGYQEYPSVAVEAGGGFVVVWASGGSAGTDTSASSIQAQRYDATGAPVGSQFQVNSYTTSAQNVAVVAASGTGDGFLVSWRSDGSAGTDTSGVSIQAQRYDPTGAPVGSQFQVNSYTTLGQYIAGVASTGAGDMVIAWSSAGSIGSDQSSFSVHAQRYAVGRTILGKKILVKDPTGSEIQRSVIALGKETATDIGPNILGDPTVNGATLRVITTGTTDSDQTYALDAGGWTAAGTTGFRYAGPTGGDGDPVKKVILKRTPGGTALVKVLLKGNTGTQSMDVVPPNAGDEGGLILTVNGGGTYCVAFGGIAGGSETQDSAQLWKLSNAGAEACPTP